MVQWRKLTVDWVSIIKHAHGSPNISFLPYCGAPYSDY